MEILIIGKGGREHALAWKVAQSNLTNIIWVAPGNAGTAAEPKVKNLPISETDLYGLLNFAKQHAINLTIVGPEIPLAHGIVDIFQKHNLPIFGPTQKASELESNKTLSKNFMKQYGIPTAPFETFQNKKEAYQYLRHQSFPIVIKACGLAAGKGVIIAESLPEAQHAVTEILENKQFGVAGNQIVIESFIIGKEVSFIAITDGTTILPLATTQDHKKRNDGDTGPNTGGMGAFSPAPTFSKSLQQTIIDCVFHPTLEALTQHNIPYVGFLYAGLMISPNEDIHVLEFNVRLGDPETQPLMMRLRSDLIPIIQATINGELHKCSPISWDPRPALSVILTANTYPNGSSQDEIITGIKHIHDPDIKIFHSGTLEKNNQIITNGGRILSVTALGKTFQEAQNKAYQTAAHINWSSGCYYRKDIGNRVCT